MRDFSLSEEQVVASGLTPPVHPGEVLADFLEGHGMTAYALAKGIGVQQTRVGEILRGERALSADTALRLGRYFGTSPEMWVRLQAQYDLEVARRESAEILAGITPREPATA